MSTTSLRSLAMHLGLPERTVRRAAREGLIHGERKSLRRFETSLSEEAYLRRHWPFLSALRGALRTEPNVRLAVLFGSLATGRGHDRSDVDLLTSLRDASAVRVAELTARLERQLGRTVQIVRLEDAEAAPELMVDALEGGRVIVDRDDQWSRLRSQLRRWRQRASHSEDGGMRDAIEALDDIEAT